MATPSLIELLEPRIAPATFVNAFVVTYTDVDGDLVKVKSSKPIFHDDLREFTFTPGGEGETLSELLLKPSAPGASLKVKLIETGAAGDGAVNVGYINAIGVDLRSVTVEGSLGRISVGDDDPTIRGIGLLHVGSLGLGPQAGLEESSVFYTGAGIVRIDGDLTGRIATFDSLDNWFKNLANIDRVFVGGNLTGSVDTQGTIGKIKVAGDLEGGEYEDSGTIVADSIGKIVIEGSVLGGGWEYSGTVEARKGIGTVVVEGDIVGGHGSTSGGFSYGGTQNASFWLGGSLIGGSGESSGTVSARQLNVLMINGDVLGGSGYYSGTIEDDTNHDEGFLGVIRIGGDVQGGSGVESGRINAEVRTSLAIRGSILGGGGGLSGYVSVSPFPNVGDAYEVRIGGDIVGGAGHSSGRLLVSDPDAAVNGHEVVVNVTVEGGLLGTLESSDSVWGSTAGSIEGAKLGIVKIGGSIIAAERPSSDAHITSYAVRASDSIGKLKVGGNIEGRPANTLAIFAGYPWAGNGSNDRIGLMTVSGDLSFTAVTAGYGEHRPGYDLFDPDARIGQVRISGDVIASSITAGIHPGADSRFGTDDDLSEAEGVEPTDIRSRIASVIIDGPLKGTADAGDAFGIAAQRLNSIKIGGLPVFLTSELDTIQLAPDTNDVLLREHA